MRICVYGASSNEVDPKYIAATEFLGEEMGRRGHSLVFGGGASGMMGAAARGVTREGGKILGIAPSFFNVDGVLYDKCTDFIFTETMRERKFLLEENADAFIISPGGIGTFEEFFEVLTLKQLGRHNKPIAVFNVNGYYDDLHTMLDKSIEGKFMKPCCHELMAYFSEPRAILDYIETCDTATMTPEQMKYL